MPREKSEVDKREARARELRVEIDRLTGKSTAAPSKKPESPAAFVQRRMAELDEQERAGKKRKRP